VEKESATAGDQLVESYNVRNWRQAGSHSFRISSGFSSSSSRDGANDEGRQRWVD